MTVGDFFESHALPAAIFEAVRSAVEELGPAEILVSKSQIAFRRRKNFAIVWMPEMYLKRRAAPLVLTLSFKQPDASPRWKEIANPAPNRYTHHLELYAAAQVDDEVRGWLRRAWQEAG